MKPLGLLFVFLLAGAPLLLASPPAWWSDSATKILDAENPATTADNYAPANLGQLKNVAKQAKAHLDTKLPGGSGTAINILVSSFEPRSGQGYTQEQIDAFIADNYAPVNLGQLKAVAKPFYDRLLAFSYDTKANLIAHGFPTSWTSNYPWNPATAVSENYAPANIGQLKAVFCFDLSAPTGQLPVWWQQYYFGHTGVDLGGDPDSDGIVNALEFALRTDPTSANGDADGDGLSDFTEIASGMRSSVSDTARNGNNPVGLIVYTTLLH